MKLLLILLSTTFFLIIGEQNADACKNATRKYSPQKTTLMNAKSKLRMGHNRGAIEYALKIFKMERGNKELSRKLIAIAFVRRGKKLQKPHSFAAWAQEDTKEWMKNEISYEQILKKSGDILSNSTSKPIDKMYYAEYLLKMDPNSAEGIEILRDLKSNKVMPNQFGWFALAKAEKIAGNASDATFATEAGEKKEKAIKKRHRRKRTRRSKTKNIVNF